MVKHILPLALLLAACAAEPVAETPSALVDAPWCAPPPFAVLHGSGFSTWASPLCKGNIARGGSSVSWDDPTPRRCAQWVTGGETEAEVLCVDRDSPVDTIYFRNIYHSNACEPWAFSTGPWFIWRSCGVQPVAPPSGEI